MFFLIVILLVIIAAVAGGAGRGQTARKIGETARTAAKPSKKRVQFAQNVKKRVYDVKTGAIMGADQTIEINDAKKK